MKHNLLEILMYRIRIGVTPAVFVFVAEIAGHCSSGTKYDVIFVCDNIK